jgi:hippurate hydrolase
MKAEPNSMTHYRIRIGGPVLMIAGLAAALLSWAVAASSVEIDASIKAIVADEASELISTFKQFHQNPELGFQEFETSATIAAHLRQLGYPVVTGVGVTGVVSVFENGPGPVVLFRSDMDALPMKEQVDISYASTKTVKDASGEPVPVMHACGHDAHSAWLMGVASVMMTLKDRWSGTLVLIAQPAEELLSGAKAMVDDGLEDIAPTPDYVIAGHQFPFWPVGSVALAPGFRMAGSVQMDVVLKGKGGHGSIPHLTIDPVVMGSQAVMAYQTVVSRFVDQSKSGVLTVGAFNAGTANNIIPDTATLKLNLRWYDDPVLTGMMNGITSVTDNIADAWGVPADEMPAYTIKSKVPSLFNDPTLVERATVSMKRVLGDQNVHAAGSPHMASEDFHLLAGTAANARVLMVEVGSGPPDVLARIKAGNVPAYPHNPLFYMEPETVLYATQAFSAVLLELLGGDV